MCREFAVSCLNRDLPERNLPTPREYSRRGQLRMSSTKKYVVCVMCSEFFAMSDSQSSLRTT